MDYSTSVFPKLVNGFEHFPSSFLLSIFSSSFASPFLRPSSTPFLSSSPSNSSYSIRVPDVGQRLVGLPAAVNCKLRMQPDTHTGRASVYSTLSVFPCWNSQLGFSLSFVPFFASCSQSFITPRPCLLDSMGGKKWPTDLYLFQVFGHISPSLEGDRNLVAESGWIASSRNYRGCKLETES